MERFQASNESAATESAREKRLVIPTYWREETSTASKGHKLKQKRHGTGEKRVRGNRELGRAASRLTMMLSTPPSELRE